MMQLKSNENNGSPDADLINYSVSVFAHLQTQIWKLCR